MYNVSSGKLSPTIPYHIMLSIVSVMLHFLGPMDSGIAVLFLAIKVFFISIRQEKVYLLGRNRFGKPV